MISKDRLKLAPASRDSRAKENQQTSDKTLKALISLQLRWSKSVLLALKSKHMAQVLSSDCRILLGAEVRETSTER